MKRFAVFASGHGSNLQAIIDAVKRKKIKAQLALVFSDKPEAYALTRARKSGIKTLVIEPKVFLDRESFDREVIKNLREERIDFVVLAGFMRILSSVFISEYRHKILNIHPSILPAFKGGHAIREAFDYGAKLTGVTVHFVDEEVDHGPIILQEAVKIDPKDTLETLEAKIHKAEHKIYPVAIDLLARGKLKMMGRVVKAG